MENGLALQKTFGWLRAKNPSPPVVPKYLAIEKTGFVCPEPTMVWRVEDHDVVVVVACSLARIVVGNSLSWCAHFLEATTYL